jgi:hypothetical protein
MDDGRSRLAVTAGRIGLLVVAVGTAWGAATTAAGSHALGAVLVAAPAVAATNPPSTTTPPAPEITARSAAPAPVSRAHVRTPLRVPASTRTASRRHVAR